MKGQRILLEPLRTFGVMEVMAKRPCPRGERKYVVYNTITNRELEEFRYRSDAESWARKHGYEGTP